MTRLDPQMKIRLADDLKISIEEAAKAAGRSMNAEIVARLEGSFEPSGDTRLLQQLADERKNTAEALGALCTTLAKMLLAAVRLFTPEQNKKAPEIGVWGAIAEGVVQGESAAIVEMFEKMKSSHPADSMDEPNEGPVRSPNAHKPPPKK